MRQAILSSFAIFLAVSSAPAFAHHSFAMFDRDSEMTIDGTVTGYAWNNPHIWIDVEVTGDNGQPVNWGLESRSVGILYRLGWGPNSLKPGDRVSVLLNPMRDGTPGGSVVTITFPDGRQLVTRADTGYADPGR